MLSYDPILDQLGVLYDRCRSPIRHRQIQRRWARYPALAGRTLDEIAAVLADPEHPDHNAVGADLLRSHRGGDHDATTVLLSAIRPVVLALTPPRTLTRPRPDDRGHLWAAAGKLVATTNPDTIAASQRPFMFTLIGHIRRDAARYRDYHTLGYVHVGDSAMDIEQHLEANSAYADTTAHATIAAVCLHQIGTYVCARRRGHDRWREVLDNALEADQSGSAARKRVLRLRPHLIRLTDAA